MRELERDHTHSAENRAHPPITVVGPGRVGASIAAAATAAGIEVDVADRAGITAACHDATVVLLCVPDDQIRSACAAVIASATQLTLIGHTSGATGLDALDAARAAGAEAFSLHPLQTIPDPQTRVAGSPAAIAGSTPDALSAARLLAESLGMDPFEVPEAARGAYHAAAAISSNFLVALEQSAVELLERAGVDGARELLTPLVLRTAANWSERGADALTGPIARGDEATVERHRAAIGELAPDLVPMYEAMAARTRALATKDSEG